MRYCEVTTSNHTLARKYPSQLMLVNVLFADEGCKRAFFASEKAINLDRIEIEQSKCKKRALKCTMDFAIGISNKGKNAQILMVELKLKVKKPENLTRKEIEEKIEHSTELLAHEPQICKEKYILFDKSHLAQAKSRISRLYGNSPKSRIKVQSPEEFRSTFFEG